MYFYNCEQSDEVELSLTGLENEKSELVIRLEDAEHALKKSSPESLQVNISVSVLQLQSTVSESSELSLFDRPKNNY